MPITVAEALRHAAQCVEARRLEQARAICQAVLAAEPENDEAYHLLGAAAWYAGDFATARAMYREAVRRDPARRSITTIWRPCWWTWAKPPTPRLRPGWR